MLSEDKPDERPTIEEVIFQIVSVIRKRLMDPVNKVELEDLFEEELNYY